MKKITVLMVLAVFSAIIGFSQSKTIVKGKITQTNLYAKDLSASTIVCNTSYIPGTTMDLEFTITINTPDDEYGDSVAMVFPAGFTINSGSDPIAIATQGQGDEALNGIAGQVISWGDNDNSYGGIEPGAHIFLVNVTIGAGVSGDQPIDYFISGDTWGGNPVDASGTCIISQPQPDDVGIIDIITPVTGMNLTATETVQVTVRNFGTNSQSNISVRYRVNGGPPKNGTVPGPIASDGTANFTFTQLADLSAPGVYAIEACTTMPGDDNNNNNCLTDSVTNYGSDIIMGLVRTINTCNSNFYDSGGPAASYQNNENDTVTIYPDIAGMRVKAVFSSFDLESGYDYLYVYDGDNTTAPQITGSPFSGSTVPSALSNLIASNPDGALTFVFISDFSINNSGWEAAISCVAAPSDDLAVLSVIMPDKYVFESSITINAVIKNNGTALKPAGQIVNFKEGAVLLGSSVTNIDLAESEIDTVNYSWNATSGYHLISAEVLPDDDSLNNISSNGIDVFKANWLVESFEGAIFPPADWTDPDTWNQWNNPVNAWHGVQYAYCSTGSTDARLITPILSVTNTDWISFWAFTAAAANFPTIKIQYSVDKVTWLDVSGIIYTLTNTYTRYQEALNLNGNFYFAFVCTNNSGASARMDLVGAPPVYLAPVDAGVIDILSPASGPMLTSSETIQILVQNFGLNPVSNIPVSYSVNGGAPVNEVISVALAPDSTVSYTFSQSADLSVPGTYTVTACTNIITDGNTANDCFTDSVINYGNSVLMGIVDTVALCSGNFYDSGGPLNPYNNNENCTLTIYPSITGNRVSVSFTAFDVETGWDYLYVYDGENTSAPQVSGSPFTGNTIPPALAELIASNPAGALTFVFISDVSVTNAGWEATITCITPPANDLSVVDVIMPDKYVFEGNTSIRAVVRNTGTNLQAAGIPVTFRQGATVYGTSATTIDLSAGETDTVNYIWVAGPAGYHHLTAEAPADDDTTNNSAIDSIDVYKPGTLVESFEGAIFPPADWSSPDTWAQWNFPANAWHGSQYVSCPAGSINSRLITPLLSVTSGDWISFWAFTSAISDFPTFKIQYSPDTVTWTDVSGNIFTLSNIKTRYQENLSLTGNYYFAFVCDNNNPTYSGRMDLVNAPLPYKTLVPKLNGISLFIILLTAALRLLKLLLILLFQVLL
ncbi:MAG: choice-of-anchor J domain-containing protein [Bacteroidia bacterium]|nr:choice-of-anchor J domain-containing protein [Bacteroidia bacterium]